MSYFSLLTDNLSEPNVDPGKDDEGEGGVENEVGGGLDGAPGVVSAELCDHHPTQTASSGGGDVGGVVLPLGTHQLT